MPLSFPNLSLASGRKIETYPLDMLDSIRNAARPPDGATGPTEIQVQLRDALYQVRHQPDEGTFNVVPWPETGRVNVDYDAVDNAKKLARELNMTWKINLYSFRVEAGSFTCSEEYLTCPITKDIPTNGVFVKVSSLSDVCYLFDKEAFLNLLPQKFAHPLSNEKIHIDMIVRKSECFFNTERENFTLR
ncbi:TPA: T3SS effector NleG family protein [Salmonella enterica]|nr:T3SS effector NleG family protein [Salmonella enterica]